MNILITGFQPFLGESLNPSELLLHSVDRHFGTDQAIETLVLPVSYKRSFEILKGKIDSGHYDFILMLGQAGGRDSVCLERVALNWIESSAADEDGESLITGPIEEGGKEVYFCSLPLEKWLPGLNKNNKVSISLSAGGFVCNHLYYKTSKYILESRKGSSCCFVHVPYCTEQVHNKAAGTPSMSLEAMESSLFEIVHYLQKNSEPKIGS